jgi:hypothetical protein
MSLIIVPIFVILTLSIFASKSISISKGTHFWEKPHITHFWQDCNTTFTLSWDDARIWDVNLAPIDERYGIRHTLFTSSYNSYPNRSFWRYSFLLDELFQGFDVQSHCGKHIHLSQYNSKEQERYIKWGKTGIEDLFGFTPIAFAYPYGDIGGSQYVEEYFTLGRTISDTGTSWPPQDWQLEGVTIAIEGLKDRNLDEMVKILRKIYHTPGYQVFKGYGHTNKPGTKYGVSNFEKYEETIAKIANWENVWYTSWGELTAYTIEKSNTQISKAIYRNNKIEFDLSAPFLNTDMYRIPITVSILIPSSWNHSFPMIDGKYTSQYSIKEVNESKVLLLDLVPKRNPQKVVIWRNSLPIIDFNPPRIQNFRIYTKKYDQNWNVKQNSTQYYTFMRFDVTDELANIHKVNASVFLHNGNRFILNSIKNPIFWGNSTYGRVIWNFYDFNNEVRQIKVEDINYIIIYTQDGFGNIRRNIIYPKINSMVESIEPVNLLPLSFDS